MKKGYALYKTVYMETNQNHFHAKSCYQADGSKVQIWLSRLVNLIRPILLRYLTQFSSFDGFEVNKLRTLVVIESNLNFAIMNLARLQQ